MPYTIGVDIGGTFTDCAILDTEGNLAVGKALTTPADYSVGVLQALADGAALIGAAGADHLLRDTHSFFHASTISDNTLITRSGARVGLICTRGFADAIFVMRGYIGLGLTESETAHKSILKKPDPLVEPYRVAEVAERLDYRGGVLAELDLAEAERVVDRLVAQGAQSVAVALLWAHVNDCHEKQIGRLIRERYPEVKVSLSSEVAPFLGEYERTATTVYAAYIAPSVRDYLLGLRTNLAERGLRREPLIMQAYGGALGVEATCVNAVGTIEAGPAAGVAASRFLGETIGEQNILAVDMGGTTFKVGLIHEGAIERENRPVVLGHYLLSPKIWVQSIGAGGGSIARVDPETALLKVGPEGAGASPGPVCYGLGGMDPTVSDADLVLGYLNPDYFLGGRMRLDIQAARDAVTERVGKPMGLSTEDAARAIRAIADAQMSDLIRRATVERGHDPREFVLFAYGGAGPAHAVDYAAELGLKEIVIPNSAAVHGAFGLISSDVVRHYGVTDRLSVPADPERASANFAALVGRAMRDLAADGFHASDITIRCSLDMRYRLQVNEVTVPVKELRDHTASVSFTDAEMSDVYAGFDTLYERLFGVGSGYREAGREIVNFRVEAIGRLTKPRLPRRATQPPSARAAVESTRQVYFGQAGRSVDTTVYRFDRLAPGMCLAGPALIEAPATTVAVGPRQVATVDEFRNVRIQLADA